MITSSKLNKMTRTDIFNIAEGLGIQAHPDIDTKASLIPQIMEQVQQLSNQAVDAGMDPDDIDKYNDPLQLMMDANAAVDASSSSGQDYLVPEAPAELVQLVFYRFFMKTVNGSRQNFTHTDVWGREWSISKAFESTKWQGLVTGETKIVADSRKQLVYAICQGIADKLMVVCDQKGISWKEFTIDNIVAFSKPVEKLSAQELENRVME